MEAVSREMFSISRECDLGVNRKLPSISHGDYLFQFPPNFNTREGEIAQREEHIRVMHA